MLTIGRISFIREQFQSYITSFLFIPSMIVRVVCVSLVTLINAHLVIIAMLIAGILDSSSLITVILDFVESSGGSM